MATRSQPVNLRIFLLNLAFDLTLNDEDFEGSLETASTNMTYNKRSYVCSSVLYMNFFKELQGQRKNSMILLTKERVDF